MRYRSIAFAILFALGLTFGLTGCGKSESDQPATPPPANNEGAMKDAMDKGATALGDAANKMADTVQTAMKVEDAPDDATCVNSMCPFSGKPVDPKAHKVTFQGKTYGFCCNDCYKTAKESSEKMAKAVASLKN